MKDGGIVLSCANCITGLIVDCGNEKFGGEDGRWKMEDGMM